MTRRPVTWSQCAGLRRMYGHTGHAGQDSDNTEWSYVCVYFVVLFIWVVCMCLLCCICFSMMILFVFFCNLPLCLCMCLCGVCVI